MAAYVILDIEEVKDEEVLAEFRRRREPLLEAHGGRTLFRCDVVEAETGGLLEGRRLIVMEFETLEQARAWPNLQESLPEAAEIRELRDRGCVVKTTIVAQGL